MDCFRISLMLLCLLLKTNGLSLRLRGSYGLIGDVVFLDCSLDGAIWSTAYLRQWKVFQPETLLFNGGTPISANGYKEDISNANTTGIFSLEITTLEWSHIGRQFECKYDFGTAVHTLSDADIEDYKNTNINVSEETTHLHIKRKITLDAIHPVPSATAILTTADYMNKDISANVLRISTSPASGNLTKVIINVDYEVDNTADYITVNLSTPGGYSKSFQFTTAKETTTAMKTPGEGLSTGAVIGIVIGVLIAAVVVVVVFVYIYKKKDHTQPRKDKESQGTLTQNVDESNKLENKPT